MLEARSEIELAEQFERFLAFTSPADQASTELQSDLRLAKNLIRMNLSAESQIQHPLRARLAQMMQDDRPGRRGTMHLSPRSRLWLSAGIAALVILFLAVNLLALTSLGRLFGWNAADQTRLAPTQVLTMAGNTPTNTRTVGLPLHLPMHGWDQSPTPGVVQMTPNFPLVVPTPGAKSRP